MKLNKADTNNKLYNLLPGIVHYISSEAYNLFNIIMKHINKIIYYKCEITHLSHGYSLFYIFSLHYLHQLKFFLSCVDISHFQVPVNSMQTES